ncbi:MAG: DUF3109 domain-containing protein [Ignavibacteriales bacterium CG_4_9_14_3_um_filter_30_11]|nr:MAG: DUF3109 domain-containing protein [Ignavibacteriales bacterium CG12_big_fil_rev_8_21_14_0_65_30_8]PJA98790.1 MAG: DUF3109 domain-containing protein [Ignavibacteriales bacterium CG_4_9_14_3_um_filter_30_11]
MPKNFEKVINGLKIDPIIFTFKFDCECTGECCHYGVYTDSFEAERILNNKDKILANFDSTQCTDASKWFEKPEEDKEFESGIAIGTEVINGKCTFLDNKGLCTLQKMANDESEYKWKYKPLYCILFPLIIDEGVLTIDTGHIKRLKTCNPIFDTKKTIFESCTEELLHLLGKRGYSQLKKYSEEYLVNKKNN